MPMLDWNGYRALLKSGVRRVGELSPETVRGYAALSTPGAHPARFDERTRELMALSVAVALRCDGCIAVHTDAARRAGADEQDLTAAIRVAISVSAGAALVYSTRALEAFSTVEADSGRTQPVEHA